MNPESRANVYARFEAQAQTVDVEPVGNGLIVVSRKSTTCTFTNLMEQAGWYMAAFRPDNDGDREFVFMPIPEADPSESPQDDTEDDSEDHRPVPAGSFTEDVLRDVVNHQRKWVTASDLESPGTMSTSDFLARLHEGYGALHRRQTSRVDVHGLAKWEYRAKPLYRREYAETPEMTVEGGEVSLS